MMDETQLRAVITRIRQMEQYLDEVTDAISACPDAIFEDAAVREKLRELDAYYQNGQWLADYECDTRGELLRDLKRGVLSQDTLYDLLCAAGDLE